MRTRALCCSWAALRRINQIKATHLQGKCPGQPWQEQPWVLLEFPPLPRAEAPGRAQTSPAPVVEDLQELQQKLWWFNCPSSLAAPWIINGNNILFMPRSSILRQRKQQMKAELFPWRKWWIRKIHFYLVPPPWQGILNSCDLLPFSSSFLEQNEIF